MAVGYYISAGLMTVGFLFLGLGDLQTWLIADTIFTAIMSLGLLIRPDIHLQMEITGVEIGGLHTLLCRFLGVMFLGLLPMWIWCRKSTDKKVVGGLLWARVLTWFGMLLTIIYGETTYSFFTEYHKVIGLLGSFLLWLANLVQLLKLKPDMWSSPGNGSGTAIFMFWFIVDVSTSVVCIGFPNILLYYFFPQDQAHDGMQIHLTRAFGCVVVGGLVFSGLAPKYQNYEDKKILLYSSILINVLCHVAILLDFMSGGLYATVGQMVPPQLAVAAYNAIFVVALATLKKDKIN